MEKVLRKIHGVFDGERMATEDGNYILVPENYAAKSKIIVGTKLVYYITDKGAYFKQVTATESHTGIGSVVTVDGALRIYIEYNGVIYRMRFLRSYQTYYKIKDGDQVVITFPKNMSSNLMNWCAIDNKLY